MLVVPRLAAIGSEAAVSPCVSPQGDIAAWIFSDYREVYERRGGDSRREAHNVRRCSTVADTSPDRRGPDGADVESHDGSGGHRAQALVFECIDVG